MQGQRRVNKDHPDFEAYLNTCNDVRKRMSDEIDGIEYTEGRDGPTTVIYKKYIKELENIQREYSYLFSEDEVSGE